MFGPMTILRRLELSFLAILVLFGLNFGILYWSHQWRTVAVENLQQAAARQVLLASILQELGNLQKQAVHLSQVQVESVTSGVESEEQARAAREFESIGKQIRELRRLSDPDAAVNVDKLEKGYQELTASWRISYENFGIDQTKAIAELANYGDPLYDYVAKQVLPKLQTDETSRVEAAAAALRGVKGMTNWTTIFVFLSSMTAAVVLARLTLSHIGRELGELKRGVTLAGNGDLNHRIAITCPDELGDLAQAFNRMSENLLSARTQLSQVNGELDLHQKEVERERLISESLMLNILPAPVAEELRTKGSVEPKYFEDATVLFTDFVDFTSFTEKLAAEDLIHVLHEYFSLFDQITAQYGLEKLKTIGDSYMCVGGVPLRNPSHPVDAVLAAFEMARAVAERSGPEGPFRWAIRIGIHTGPIIAGMVGKQKFAYDVWGETVNYASRMESSGMPNRINLSGQTYSRVKDFIECEYRGKLSMKGHKRMEMYFANGIQKNLVDDIKQVPPPAFLRRYQGYFQKDPPSFPAFLNRIPT